ncbi:MAG: LysM peptidoglycan-binding domain-containing protein [Planctomycetes bacterium]|nr:LysM peptidoglycan-binding domain-containing protein [Planctomycetota bacterium]
MRSLLARLKGDLATALTGRLRPAAAGVLSLLFLLAITTFLVRRERPPTRPVRATERPSLEPESDARPGRYHAVQAGDTLESLARRFYADPARWPEIARANDVRNPRALQIGTVLWIPDLHE